MTDRLVALSYKDSVLKVDFSILPKFEELKITVKPFEPSSGVDSQPCPNIYLELKTNLGWLKDE